MDLGIRGRVALVTGASSGIGEAVALALAQEGAMVAVAARRRSRLNEVARAAKALGAGDAVGFEVDFANEQSIGRLVAEVQSTLGPIDILVTNGGGPKAGTFINVPLSDWDSAYQTVLRGMLQLVHSVLPGMTSRKWGRIVALASTSVKQPIPNLVLSNAFRTAFVAALKTLSSEVAPLGVTVNSIATGRILTERLLQFYNSEDELHDAAQVEIPMQRVATPAEFAPMVAFLCSQPAQYVTGQIIAVDGGLVKGLL